MTHSNLAVSNSLTNTPINTVCSIADIPASNNPVNVGNSNNSALYEKSLKIGAWGMALSQFQGDPETRTIFKNKEAQLGKFKYKYADFQIIVDTVRPILKRYGLCFTQMATSNTKTVSVVTMVIHGESDQYVASLLEMPITTALNKSGEAILNSLQESGKAITYAKRYALKAALGLAESDDDNDGNINNENKQRQQKISNEELKILKEKLVLATDPARPGLIEGKIYAECKINRLEDMPTICYGEYINRLDARIAKIKEKEITGATDINKLIAAKQQESQKSLNELCNN